MPLCSKVFAQTNTEDSVVNGQSDLTASATYTSGTPTTSSDVTFLGSTTYSPTAFTLNTTAFNLAIGTLDDLDATQTLTIQNTTSGSVSTITLDGGGNSVAPSNGGVAGDLLYVASGGTLTIGGGAGTLGIALGATTGLGNVGNFDVAGTATISSVISGTGNGFTMTGNGTLTLSATNTYSGGTIIGNGTSSSTLKLGGSSSSTVTTLQRNPTNNTTVMAGSTLDLNGSSIAAYTGTLTISGSGVGGVGALTNSSATGLTVPQGVGAFTLAANATIGGVGRLDINGLVTGGGFTLTKVGRQLHGHERSDNQSAESGDQRWRLGSLECHWPGPVVGHRHRHREHRRPDHVLLRADRGL